MVFLSILIQKCPQATALLKTYIYHHGSSAQAIIDPFYRVSDLNTFKRYLQSTPGLYPKLVLGAIDHPFPAEENRLIHHAMSKFLTRYGIDLAKIETPYNLVSISRIMHFVMHEVRLVEYALAEDSSAVQLMLKHHKSNHDIVWGSNSSKKIAEILSSSLHSQMMQNYPQYNKEVSTKRNAQIKELAITKMADETITILSMETTWSNINNPEFTFIYASKSKTLSLDHFTHEIIKAYTEYQKQNNQKPLFNEPLKFRTIRDSFGKYFRGKARVVYGFYIVNRPDFIKTIL